MKDHTKHYRQAFPLAVFALLPLGFGSCSTVKVQAPEQAPSIVSVSNGALVSVDETIASVLCLARALKALKSGDIDRYEQLIEGIKDETTLMKLQESLEKTNVRS